MIRRQSTSTILGLALAASAASSVPGDIVHVPIDAPTIQAGIELAGGGDEVVVADGVYNGAGNRNIDFLGKPITVRSANGPAGCVLDGGGAVGRRGFAFIRGEGAASRLEGFTFRNFVTVDDGAGVQALNAGPTIVDCVFEMCESIDGNGAGLATTGGVTLIERCTFRQNIALRGAGLAIEGSGNVVRDCVFECNTAGIRGGGASGCATFTGCRFTANQVVAKPYVSFFGVGGAVAGAGDLLVVEDCTFEANGVTAPDAALGGAIGYINGDGVHATRCVFRGNVVVATADYPFREALGGGVFSCNAGTTVHGCLFLENLVSGAPGEGPAIYHDGRDFEAVNCTAALNQAEPADDAASVQVFAPGRSVVVANCVLHGMLACGLEITGGDEDVSYSSLDCAMAGTGNITGDPGLSPDGNLAPGSPCIDSGSNSAVPPALTTDLDGDARRVDDPGTPDTGEGTAPIVDMGADEFVGASCPEDVDGNGEAGFGDVLAVLAAWGPCSGCPEDVDGDGDAGFSDILDILVRWGPCE